MVNFRNKRLAAPVALLVSLMLTTTVALVWGSAATSAATSRAAAAARPVAEGPGGELRSRIVGGETANGREVTGKFVPLHFTKRNGKVFVRGLVQGVVHNADGSTARRFGVMRTVRVKSIEGTPIRTARAAARGAACDILHLVLGPLDLDLLGLQIHLNRVVLNIDADPGPGNLLGNLLCSVAGLLDGGLNGLLGRLTRLLNRILGQLGLGL